MINKKKLSIVLAFICILIGAVFSACTGDTEQPPAGHTDEPAMRETLAEADIRGAVNAIYASLENYKVRMLNPFEVNEYYGIGAEDIAEFTAFRSDPREGICDIMIIQPVSGSADRVRACLYAYQSDRITEFVNYNILSSYEIAQNAVVYDQGEYIIMLMFKDNEAVRAIIDDYIPQ